MNRSAYPLKLPASIKRAAQQLAKEDGVSLNQWISVAVAQKVGSVQTAAEFFARHSSGAKGDLTGILNQVPDAAPMPGDELPAELRLKIRPASTRSAARTDNGKRRKNN